MNTDVDIPMLLAEVERLQARVDELESLIATVGVGIESKSDGFGYRANHGIATAEAVWRIGNDWIERRGGETTNG